jgi:hypothetical protein
MKRRHDYYEKMGAFVQGLRDISKDRTKRGLGLAIIH